MIVKAHMVTLRYVSCRVGLSLHSTFEPRRIKQAAPPFHTISHTSVSILTSLIGDLPGTPTSPPLFNADWLSSQS